MVESGSATTIYQGSYGKPAFSTVLNVAMSKCISKEVVDTVYGMSGDPISPVVALLGGKTLEGVKSVGGKLVWVANKTLPPTVTSALRGQINPVYDDDWSDQLEMPIGAIRTDIMLDKSLYQLFLAGDVSLVDAYSAFLKRFAVSHQEGLVRRFYGDGVQGWDGNSATPALYNFTNDAGFLPIVGYGFPVESAARENAILSSTNTYGGKNRSTAPNAKYRARLWDAQSATDFPAASSPGTFATVGAMSIAHLMYVANHTFVGTDMCDTCLMSIEEWLQFQNLAQVQSIMANPNGTDPTLRKWGFDHFVVGKVRFVCDKLFARPGQMIFTNFEYTKFYSVTKAELTTAIEQPLMGKDQYFQKMYTIGQFISKQPGCNAVLYNYGL
ncbi:MAG: hypothetical protein WC551_10635 [Patescibacteria group bacterium]